MSRTSTRLLLALALATAPLATVPLVAAPAHAQSAAAHLAQGERDEAARNAAGALAHYEAALAAEPSSYAAAWRASKVAVDLGEFHEDAAQRRDLYARAERYARSAVSANPTGAEGHFALARALGRTALTLGPRDRVQFANDVRRHALAALEAEPNHAGALHVLGVWNAEIMRLSGVQRFFAKNLLGGSTFGEASWANAVQRLERAVAIEPERIAHRLDLAAIYVDVGDRAQARAQLERIATMPATEYNDAHYKRQAAERLRALATR